MERCIPCLLPVSIQPRWQYEIDDFALYQLLVMHTTTAFAATRDMCLAAYRVEMTVCFVCKLECLGEIDISRSHAMVIHTFQVWRLLPGR